MTGTETPCDRFAAKPDRLAVCSGARFVALPVEDKRNLIPPIQ
jgi:hypothetical protein